MPTTDPLQILLTHDHWATGLILDACSTLTLDQFHQRFDIGPGSLHDTLTHMLSAVATWNQTLAGLPQTPRLDQTPQRRSLAELRSLLDTCARDLAAQTHRLPLAETVSRQRDGKTYHFTRAVVLTHVTTHGMHHRAQCLNMLRHLGVEPLPPSSIAEWSRMTDIAN